MADKKAKSGRKKKSSSSSKGVVITLTREKDTSGARRYKEDGMKDKDPDSGVIGTLYIRKAQADRFGGSLPETLKVTIE